MSISPSEWLGRLAVSDDDIFKRLNRLYAAVGATIEADLSKFPPTVIDQDGMFGIAQDFLGGLSPEEIENLAHSMIANIANFRTHLRAHAKSHPGTDVGEILAVLDQSRPFQIIKDLFNNEKHGYRPRGGGFSGLSPQLTDVNRVLQLTTGPVK